MDCENGAAGEDRSKVGEFKEEILQLAALASQGEENSRAELLEKFNKCNKDTLVELIRSFDMTGSKANRKEELVTKLMEFFKVHCPDTNSAYLDKALQFGDLHYQINDFKEQTLQLARLAFHEEEEKSQAELLEKLNKSNKDTIVELCRSFDIIGSKANRKEELVIIMMEFLKEHCSGTDATDPDKKTKKRRRKNEVTHLSGSKPLKKMKLDGTSLEIHGEEEDSGAKYEENITKYSECDLDDNNNECANNEKGRFPKNKASLEPSERVNDVPKNFVGAAPTEVQILSNEQALSKTPFAKVVSTVEGDRTDMKTSGKKNASITKKKMTSKTDRKEKFCGKQMYKGDGKPRKLAAIPNRDELRQAVFLILDSADFATMTFGDVVKEVDKYFGKDLFEKKPLIRSLIEEELFRLGEEAEKKELEEEAAEVKARAEQAAKEGTNAGVNSGIDTAEALQVKDGKSEDAAKNKRDNSAENGPKGGVSVEVAENINRSAAAESSQDGRILSGDHVEYSRDGEAERAKMNSNGEAVEAVDGGTEASKGGESADPKDDNNRNGDKSALDIDDRGAEDSHCNKSGENVACVENGKTNEAGNTENGENVVSHDAEKDGKRKDPIQNASPEQTLTDAGDDGKTEDAEHNANTEADVDSCADGTAEN
uniref:DEK-C domain-containing protein n=1 Tax=Oryza glumipatula TaxID=40148 RepID=A0A0D9Z8V1_9ORYZ